MKVNYNYSEIRLTKYNFIKNIDHKAFKKKKKKKQNIDHNFGICFVLYYYYYYYFWEILIQAYNYKFQNI